VFAYLVLKVHGLKLEGIWFIIGRLWPSGNVCWLRTIFKRLALPPLSHHGGFEFWLFHVRKLVLITRWSFLFFELVQWNKIWSCTKTNRYLPFIRKNSVIEQHTLFSTKVRKCMRVSVHKVQAYFYRVALCIATTCLQHHFYVYFSESVFDFTIDLTSLKWHLSASAKIFASYVLQRLYWQWQYCIITMYQVMKYYKGPDIITHHFTRYMYIYTTRKEMVILFQWNILQWKAISTVINNTYV
jgi:hypothetical protein